MHNKENDRDLIDKYLQDSLSDSERGEFIGIMEADSTLKSEVLKEKKIIAALKASDKAQLKKNLESVSADVTVNTSKKFNPLWLAAASIVLLASATYFIYFSGPSAESLFKQYYEPYPALGIQRGDTSSESNGLILYEKGMYKEALNSFKHEKNKGKQVYYLLVGNCHLQLSNIDDAIKNFQTLANVSNDSILKQYAEWYLAMSYLKQGSQEKVELLLNQIIEQQGIYAKQATDLYNSLH